MITGEVPFKAEADYQTFQLILERKLTFPESMDPTARDLIDQLLQLDPLARLGCGPLGTPNDISAIKKHPFFADLDFETIPSTKVPLPVHLLGRNTQKTTVRRQKSALGATVIGKDGSQ